MTQESISRFGIQKLNHLKAFLTLGLLAHGYLYSFYSICYLAEYFLNGEPWNSLAPFPKIYEANWTIQGSFNYQFYCLLLAAETTGPKITG